MDLKLGSETLSISAFAPSPTVRALLPHGQPERAERASDDMLSELSADILALLNTPEHLSAAKIGDLIGANRNTLKVRLRGLLAGGRLGKNGKARAIWYSL